MTDFKIVGVTNVLQHISFPVAILISLLSWGLGIPVDYRGLATYKNHFFHSLNTLSCAAAMLVLDQDWRSGSLVLPFRYGLAYALSQFVLQRLGDKNHKYLLLLLLHVWHVQASRCCTPSWTSRLPPGWRWAWCWAAPRCCRSYTRRSATPRTGFRRGGTGPGITTRHVSCGTFCDVL